MSSETCFLQDVAEVVDSLHKTPRYSECGEPMVRVTDVKYGELDLSKTFRVDEGVFAEFSRRYKPSRGDIIITRVGTYGVFAKVLDTNFCLGQNTAAIIPKTISPDYLYAVLNSEFVKTQIESSVVGSTQKTLSLKAIKALQIPRFMPSQELAIGSLAAGFDDRITLLRETNTTLEAIAQALFKSWFVDFDPVHAKMQGRAPEGMDQATAALFPDSFEESELGAVPKGWKWVPLNVAYEINPPRKLKKGETAPYLDMAGVQTRGHSVGGVVQREMGSGTKFINGDTLLARITPCLENGKTAFVDFLPADTTGWGSTEFVVLRPKDPLPSYHAYLLARHPAFREHAIRSMSGTSGRQRIQNDVLSQFFVTVPPESVGQAFSELVTVIQTSINEGHQQAMTLSALRDTLLPRLISGQLRLPEVQAIVESV